MRMIEPSDFALFGAWDGLLVAVFSVVCGVLCRQVADKLRRTGVVDPTLGAAHAAGTVVMLCAVAAGIAAWSGLPRHGVGVWGSAAIVGILLAYWEASSVLVRFLPREGRRKAP